MGCGFNTLLLSEMQIIITLLLNSHQKSLKTNIRFWIRLCTKPTETLQYTHFSSCHPVGVNELKASSKVKPSGYSEQIPQKKIFKWRLKEFQKYLRDRGYPQNLINLTISMTYTLKTGRRHLQQKSSWGKTILPFVAQHQPSVPSLKNILTKHRQLIENQPLLRQIYKETPIISHKRGKSLKDILAKTKLWEFWKSCKHVCGRRESGLSTLCNIPRCPWYW